MGVGGRFGQRLTVSMDSICCSEFLVGKGGRDRLTRFGKNSGMQLHVSGKKTSACF